ncbi:hypothetical protein [Salinarimonas rosea]|uniref:hypothetical protein n=1 Tax=Salinarimonas rosea TaxID=552063 RepID=UPI000410931E|nr:hypothetical protein [Salinarimonas rosea]
MQYAVSIRRAATTVRINTDPSRLKEIREGIAKGHVILREDDQVEVLASDFGRDGALALVVAAHLRDRPHAATRAVVHVRGVVEVIINHDAEGADEVVQSVHRALDEANAVLRGQTACGATRFCVADSVGETEAIRALRVTGVDGDVLLVFDPGEDACEKAA